MAKPLPTPEYSIDGRKLRPLLLEQVPTTLFDAPPGAEGIRLRCSCGHSYPPPWTQKLPFEFSPKIAADNTLLMPPPLAVPCPVCRRENDYAFPSAKVPQAIADVYGDNSTMHLEERPEVALVYAFVAIHPGSTAGIQNKMDAVKRLLRPHAEPRSWAFHTKKLYSQRDRAKLGITMPPEKIDEAVRDLASVLSVHQDARLLSVTLVPPFDIDRAVNRAVPGGDPDEKHKAEQSMLKNLRDLVLAAGITFVTEFLTRPGHGWGAKFTLEAETLDHDKDHIDWQVERIGRGLRFDLNFVHVCNGYPIGLPVTAGKAPIVELELADLVSYMVRRFFHKAMLGEPINLPLDLIGRVFWGVWTGERIGTHTAVGYPADHFFPPERG